MVTENKGKIPTLIVGLGNSLMADDGVGIYIVEQLSAMPRPPHVRVADCGTDILKVVSHIADAQRIIFIDAVDAGAAPGTIFHFDKSEILKMPGQNQAAHQLSATESLRLLDKLYPGFRMLDLHLIGVQPAIVEIKEGLSEQVRHAAQLVLAEIRQRYF